MKKFIVWSRVSATLLVWVMGATVIRAQTFTTIVSFNGADGAEPTMVLVQGSDGNLYGTTGTGGSKNAGTVFKITPTGTLTTLYNFCSQTNCADGFSPFAGLTQATDGNFYGTTALGGTNTNCNQPGQSCGTVFKITPGGTLTTLHSFGGTDGSFPNGLVQATDGDFYGTTQESGANNAGTVFKITPDGTLTTLYNFCFQTNCTDGGGPSDTLIQATDGNLYGTTFGGGLSGLGTVFKITPAGTLTTLHSFDGTNGSRLPSAGLVQATDGNFYGTTVNNPSGGGTVFKLTPDGTLTTLHTFSGPDGLYPYAGLVQATDGNLYGTTFFGGAAPPNCGTLVGNLPCGSVFKITLQGTLSTLYSFCPQTPCTDGAAPLAGLMQATNGKLYGTTDGGGASGVGTVFSLDAGLGSLAPPTITSISPTSTIAGGSAFTLTMNGTGFVSSSVVNFGANALVTNFVSSTQLTAIILASDITTAGNFNVTVTNPGGATSNSVSFTVLTPQQATQIIINAVNALFSLGVLNGGQDNSLVVQLEHAINMMNAGKNAGAIGILDSFISEVNDLLSSGVLSPSQAASLVNAAQSVIARLS